MIDFLPPSSPTRLSLFQPEQTPPAANTFVAKTLEDLATSLRRKSSERIPTAPPSAPPEETLPRLDSFFQGSRIATDAQVELSLFQKGLITTPDHFRSLRLKLEALIGLGQKPQTPEESALLEKIDQHILFLKNREEGLDFPPTTPTVEGPGKNPPSITIEEQKRRDALSASIASKAQARREQTPSPAPPSISPEEEKARDLAATRAFREAESKGESYERSVYRKGQKELSNLDLVHEEAWADTETRKEPNRPTSSGFAAFSAKFKPVAPAPPRKTTSRFGLKHEPTDPTAINFAATAIPPPPTTRELYSQLTRDSTLPQLQATYDSDRQDNELNQEEFDWLKGKIAFLRKKMESPSATPEPSSSGAPKTSSPPPRDYAEELKTAKDNLATAQAAATAAEQSAARYQGEARNASQANKDLEVRIRGLTQNQAAIQQDLDQVQQELADARAANDPDTSDLTTTIADLRRELADNQRDLTTANAALSAAGRTPVRRTAFIRRPRVTISTSPPPPTGDEFVGNTTPQGDRLWEIRQPEQFSGKTSEYLAWRTYVLQYLTSVQRRIRSKDEVVCAFSSWVAPNSRPQQRLTALAMALAQAGTEEQRAFAALTTPLQTAEWILSLLDLHFIDSTSELADATRLREITQTGSWAAFYNDVETLRLRLNLPEVDALRTLIPGMKRDLRLHLCAFLGRTSMALTLEDLRLHAPQIEAEFRPASTTTTSSRSCDCPPQWKSHRRTCPLFRAKQNAVQTLTKERVITLSGPEHGTHSRQESSAFYQTLDMIRKIGGVKDPALEVRAKWCQGNGICPGCLGVKDQPLYNAYKIELARMAEINPGHL
jgi:hypothetical protein